jgi:hypothetical protein
MSAKVRDTHSVGSIGDHDFGVFAITEIAMKDADAVAPVYLLPRTPSAPNRGHYYSCAPGAPLTRLARLAGWQALSTGHVAPR